MVRVARIAYVILAWLFVVGMVAQVFFIGVGIFGDPALMAQYRELHRNVGWILHLVPLLVLVAAFLARAGRSHWLWALALAVVGFIFPILAAFRTAPFVAALHPVGAVIAFVLAVVVAMNALRALRTPLPVTVAA